MGPTPTTSYRRFYDVNGWLFVSTALALIGVFMAWPILQSLWMSLHAGQGTVVEFVGAGNVQRLVNDPCLLYTSPSPRD